MDKPRQFLVPIDLSEASRYALEYAMTLAVPLGGKVDVLHVYTIPIIPDGLNMTLDVLEKISRDAQAALDRVVAPYRASPALRELLLREGDARQHIVDLADELNTDIIVMGAHSKHGLKRALFGSVTEAVLRTAPCPVLAIRPPFVVAETHHSTLAAGERCQSG